MYTNGPLAAGRYTPMSVSIIGVLVVAVYATLFGNYRPHTAIDTPWDLSFSYNYCIKGIETDPTFRSVFPGGMGGTVAFGKLAAMVQCAALAPFNWSLVAANVFSVAGVVLSMAAIFAFLVKVSVASAPSPVVWHLRQPSRSSQWQINPSTNTSRFSSPCVVCCWPRAATFSLPV
jgi:hypothetical protein